MHTCCKTSLFFLSVFILSLLCGCDSALVDNGDDGSPSVALFTLYFDTDGLSNSNVNGLAMDYSRYGLWVATQKGVSFHSLRDSTWTTYGTESGLPNLKIITVAVNLGTVWAGTNSGASSLSDSLWRDLPNPNVLPHPYITAIVSMPEPDFSLWFCTHAGVVQRTPLGEWTSYNGLSSDDITSIARDSEGNIWVGSQYGLNRFDGMKWAAYTSAAVLPSTQVQAVFADSFGNVWAGTSNGIVEFKGSQRIRFGTVDGLPSPVINTFAEDFNRVLWVGTNQGVASFNGVTWSPLKLPAAVDGLPVIALASDALTRSLWIGTTNGLVRYQSVTNNSSP